MNERAEKFRQQLQKELGLTVGPKDPILAEWLAQEEFREELAAEHQRMLVAFEAALMKSQASWSESAKSLANQSLNAALGTAREKMAAQRGYSPCCRRGKRPRFLCFPPGRASRPR